MSYNQTLQSNNANLEEILEIASNLPDISNNSYTLPVASADTLGGVKVGKGLEMDGETLYISAAKREAEKLFETTLTEDVSKIDINLPVRTQHARVVIYPQETLSEPMYIYVTSDDAYDVENDAKPSIITDAMAITPDTLYIGDLIQRYMCDLVNMGGLLFCYWSLKPKEYSDAAPRHLNKSIRLPLAGIGHIQVNSIVEGKELRAGTKIEIWG